MPERIVTVASRVGLHARPAAVFVKAASAAPVPVTIAKEGKDPVSARRSWPYWDSTCAVATR
jgi:phosphocarrier protein